MTPTNDFLALPRAHLISHPLLRAVRIGVDTPDEKPISPLELQESVPSTLSPVELS